MISQKIAKAKLLFIFKFSSRIGQPMHNRSPPPKKIKKIEAYQICEVYETSNLLKMSLVLRCFHAFC